MESEKVDRDRPLIPTLDKDILTKGLSYPLGAQAISRALESVPQFDLLRIAFGRQTYKFDRSYSPKEIAGFSDIFQINPDSFNGEWWIFVKALDSRFRSPVKRVIEERILPLAKDWLLTCDPEKWKYSIHYFQAAVHVETKQLIAMETAKSEVIDLKFFDFQSEEED